MATPIRFNRRLTGSPGAPSALRTAEPAYNMVDGIIYIGFGDDGSGNGTSIKVFAKDDFIGNVPAGGTLGQALVKTSNLDGAWGWQTITSGGSYSASNDGIHLEGTVFELDYAEIATGLALASTYAPLSHTHSASDITSGVLDIARIPVLPSQKTVTSSSNIAALTAPQQAEIGEGTVVTTTDGRRWVYSGTGSKTSEASYIELADITPEWSAVANKPSFATVSTSGAYSDLSGRPTLGTMSSQNSNNVSITGGTIDGIELDGGTF